MAVSNPGVDGAVVVRVLPAGLRKTTELLFSHGSLKTTSHLSKRSTMQAAKQLVSALTQLTVRVLELRSNKLKKRVEVHP